MTELYEFVAALAVSFALMFGVGRLLAKQPRGLVAALGATFVPLLTATIACFLWTGKVAVALAAWFGGVNGLIAARRGAAAAARRER